MKKYWKIFISAMLTLMLCIGMFIAFGTQDVKAADIASGTSGSCSWVIDENGAMTIRPTNGTEGTVAETSGRPAWQNYLSSVTSVYVEPGVKMSSSSWLLFANMSNCVTMDLHNLDFHSYVNQESYVDHLKRIYDEYVLENKTVKFKEGTKKSQSAQKQKIAQFFKGEKQAE